MEKKRLISEKNMNKYVFLIACLGLVTMSTSAIFVRWAAAPSMILSAYRKTFATLILLPVVLIHNREELKHLTLSQLGWCGLSGAFFGLHLYTYMEGVSYTSIAASQILVSCEIIFVAFFMWITRQEKASVLKAVSIAIALGGSVLVALNKGGEAVYPVYGNAMSLMAAILLGAYSLIGARQRQNMTTNVYTFLVYGCAALVLDILILFSGYSFTGYAAQDYLCALAMAVFSSLLGHSIFNWALKYLGPTLVSIIRLANPILATVWGVILLSEMPVWNQVVGGIVVIGGILLYNIAKNRKQR